MAEDKGPDEATKRLLRGLFSEYYAKKAEFSIPSLEKREFGIGNVKKIDARHLCFGNEHEFRNYLITNTPLFVSHSAAYYERPGATPQDRKGWLGADLIFDLDLHAEGKYGVYAVLGRVRQDVIRLVEDFLAGDFGIAKKEMAIVFSGNRGYHVHIRDAAYHDLGPEERRELGDYINGIGLDYTRFFNEEEIPGRRIAKVMGPKPTDYGYRGRFAKAVVKAIENEPKKISTIFSNTEKRQKFVAGINEGDYNRSSIDNIVERLKPIADSLPVNSIDTDKGVTMDVHKLIRVPNSIHGETGLMAAIVPDIHSFSPLDDALAFSMTKSRGVELIEDVPALHFGKQEFGAMKKGEKKELPEAFAIFLLAKGSAKSVHP